MAKQLSFDSDARDALCRGVDKVARAVRATLGPRGRTVILGSATGIPTITMDGATVAQDIELADPVENLGAQLLREVSSKTQADAGDGTTTATVLAQAIVIDGLKHVAAGANPMSMKRGIERAVGVASRDLAQRSRPIDGLDDIRHVARVSAGLDDELAEVVAAAMERVGADGVVSVEEAPIAGTALDVTEGFAFDGGYLSPYFVTDSGRLEVVLDEPYILAYAGRIEALDDVVPVLEAVAGSGRSLLVVAEEVEGEALSTLVVNALRGTLRCAAVRTTTVGGARQGLLEDLGVSTGARVLSPRSGDTLRAAGIADLGGARRIVVDQDATTIVGGRGDRAELAKHERALARELDNASLDHERRELARRRARVGIGVAVVRVGAPTELAMRARRARLEDALAATRAALREGVVAGGGVGLLRTESSLDGLDLEGDEALGAAVVRRAVSEPLRRIAINAGQTGAIVVDRVRRLGDGHGFNAWTQRYEDLIAAGIVDPTLVVRVALVNAASIGGLMLTTDAVVADSPETGEDGE